jgi:hypothetical protein
MRPSGRSLKTNALIIVLLFAAGALFSYWGSSKVTPEIRITALEPRNVWFQADVARVYSNMTERRSDHYRTKVHPLFSISTNPLIHLLHKFGVDKDLAVTVNVAVLQVIQQAAALAHHLQQSQASVEVLLVGLHVSC